MNVQTLIEKRTPKGTEIVRLIGGNTQRVGFELVRYTYLNPFTFFKSDGKGGWTSSMSGSSRGVAALSPAFTIVHEWEHYYKKFVVGAFPEFSTSLQEFDEETAITKDIDQYLKGHPDVAQRSWYGDTQNKPGERYVLGPKGEEVLQHHALPPGRDWVRYPSDAVLEAGK